jgi:hypothetical protein
MLVGLSPRDLPLRWEDMMQNGLETRLHKSNFDFEANTADVARTCGVVNVAQRSEFHLQVFEKKRECCFEIRPNTHTLHPSTFCGKSELPRRQRQRQRQRR